MPVSTAVPLLSDMMQTVGLPNREIRAGVLDPRLSASRNATNVLRVPARESRGGSIRLDRGVALGFLGAGAR
jgi:hypothetical protein